MASFSNNESIEDFKLRLNSLTEKLNRTTKNLNQTLEKNAKVPQQSGPRPQAMEVNKHG